ncbi:hypothetical protein Taro_044127 [Colocasia esculenta]|uniref:Uncharacterized protein n=1 Tax=Colocasia esculenta TaxID=4460 RepID=A0A843WL27_COLES|nr:hypothetical protein [Colocasia esculenta]
MERHKLILQPFFPCCIRTPKTHRCLNILHPNPRDEFRTCWGRVEELLVAEELWNDHKKLIFFPVASAMTCTDSHLEVDQRDEFRTCWGHAEELLVAEELWNDHKKLIFFLVASAATCIDSHLEVDQRLWLREVGVVFLLVRVSRGERRRLSLGVRIRVSSRPQHPRVLCYLHHHQWSMECSCKV